MYTRFVSLRFTSKFIVITTGMSAFNIVKHCSERGRKPEREREREKREGRS